MPQHRLAFQIRRIREDPEQLRHIHAKQSRQIGGASHTMKMESRVERGRLATSILEGERRRNDRFGRTANGRYGHAMCSWRPRDQTRRANKKRLAFDGINLPRPDFSR